MTTFHIYVLDITNCARMSIYIRNLYNRLCVANNNHDSIKKKTEFTCAHFWRRDEEVCEGKGLNVWKTSWESCMGPVVEDEISGAVEPSPIYK